MAQELSTEGALFIANFEGFEPKPYRDAVGVWTIGYGSTKGVGPTTPPITQAQALARLRKEVTETYGAAVNALGLPLNQNQFDALVSFVYNLGPGAISKDTGIGRALRASNWKIAADEMLKWDKAGNRRLLGLTRRRQAERKLFLKRRALRYPAHELKMVHRINYHRNAALKAPKGSTSKRQHARYRELWKARARAQMRALRISAKVSGWARNGRGARYQLLKTAVQP